MSTSKFYEGFDLHREMLDHNNILDQHDGNQLESLEYAILNGQEIESEHLGGALSYSIETEGASDAKQTDEEEESIEEEVVPDHFVDAGLPQEEEFPEDSQPSYCGDLSGE